jgi:hypothetical protein
MVPQDGFVGRGRDRPSSAPVLVDLVDLDEDRGLGTGADTVDVLECLDPSSSRSTLNALRDHRHTVRGETRTSTPVMRT